MDLGILLTPPTPERPWPPIVRDAEGHRAIHYTHLPPSSPGSPLHEEWEFYRREVGRLLAEGHEGRHVLIKGSEIIGIYDTRDEALAEGSRRYFLQRQPYLAHEIRELERLIVSYRFFRCPM
jgi:hypothetical protein